MKDCPHRRGWMTGSELSREGDTLDHAMPAGRQACYWCIHAARRVPATLQLAPQGFGKRGLAAAGHANKLNQHNPSSECNNMKPLSRGFLTKSEYVESTREEAAARQTGHCPRQPDRRIAQHPGEERGGRNPCNRGRPDRRQKHHDARVGY